MEQIKKNTVSSENQVKKVNVIRFFNENGKGKKILFVGNSITFHGRKDDIGWYGNWGMAASSEENDYVHILMKHLSEKFEDAAYCICQVASWERSYSTGEECLDTFKEAKNFGADIIILRLIENCPTENFNPRVFNEQYKKLVDYLNGQNTASQIIVTSGFYKHPGDSELENVAKERNYDFIYLGDLGELDEMKAIGLFEHSGVQNHPGDKGMATISARIEETIK